MPVPWPCPTLRPLLRPSPDTYSPPAPFFPTPSLAPLAASPLGPLPRLLLSTMSGQHSKPCSTPCPHRRSLRAWWQRWTWRWRDTLPPHPVRQRPAQRPPNHHTASSRPLPDTAPIRAPTAAGCKTSARRLSSHAGGSVRRWIIPVVRCRHPYEALPRTHTRAHTLAHGHTCTHA
jgi:hypothetical protein